jgi:hypothetical protein
LFWVGDGRWTANALAARDFGSSSKCIQYALTERLAGTEVVLSFDNPLYDIALPLHEPGLDSRTQS